MKKQEDKKMINKLTKQDTDDLIINLMMKHHITLKDVDNCAKKHWSKIKEMMGIFDHKTYKDQQLTLNLLTLLTQEQSNKFVDFYSREYNLSLKTDLSIEDVKLLLTACLYNPTFFSYSLRLCERIKSRLDVKADVLPCAEAAVRKKNKSKFEIKTDIPNTKNEDIKAEYKIFKSHNQIDFVFPKPIEEKSVATPADDGYEEFFKKTITYKEHSGTLVFWGDKYNRVYLEFCFDKCIKKVPFELELCFTTTHDQKQHTIRAYKPRKDMDGNITAISSEDEYRDIDYSGGIDANYKVSLKLLPNE